MTPEKPAYIRGLSASSMKEFQLSALNRFANARRDSRDSRAALEECRAVLKFVEQVKKERELGNILEFPVPVEAVPVATVKSGNDTARAGCYTLGHGRQRQVPHAA